MNYELLDNFLSYMRFIIMLDIVDCNNTGPGEELGTYTSLDSGDRDPDRCLYHPPRPIINLDQSTLDTRCIVDTL